jgi:hypothetical protein
MKMNIKIQNSKQSFVTLWRELERTRQRFATEYRRFCPRRILRDWFGEEATDDFIWDVCYSCNQEGYNELPPPAEAPMKCREFLRALVTVKLGLSEFKINRSALDAAYNQVFPDSKPLNVRKRKKPTPRAKRKKPP